MRVQKTKALLYVLFWKYNYLCGVVFTNPFILHHKRTRSRQWRS